jgi:hypothetical protein
LPTSTAGRPAGRLVSARVLVDLSPYTANNIRSVTVNIQEQGLHNGPYFDLGPSYAQTVYIDSLK